MTNPTPYQPTPEQHYAPPQYQPQASPPVENPVSAPATQYAPPVTNPVASSAPASQYVAPVENPVSTPEHSAAYSTSAQPTFQSQPYAPTQPQIASSQYGPSYSGGYQTGGSSTEVNKLAWASLLVSGFGVFGSLLALAGVGLGMIALFICPLVGAILGHFALRDIKRSGGTGRGIALAGVITGWATLGIQLVVSVGLAILFFMMLAAFSV